MSETRDLARKLLDSAQEPVQAIAGVGFALCAIYDLLDERLPKPHLCGTCGTPVTKRDEAHDWRFCANCMPY